MVKCSACTSTSVSMQPLLEHDQLEHTQHVHVDEFIRATVAVAAVALLFFFRHNCSSQVAYLLCSVGEVSTALLVLQPSTVGVVSSTKAQ